MCNRAKNHILTNGRSVDGRPICSECKLYYEPMIAQGLKALMVLMFTVLVLVTGAYAFTVDSDGYAVFEDSRVYVRAPLTTGAGYPILTGEILSKQYTGDMNLFFLLDTDILTPLRGSISTVIPDEIAYTCPVSASYTNNAGVVTCFIIDENASQSTLFSVEYDRVNVAERTVYVDSVRRVTRPVASVIKRTDIDYNGKDTLFIIENLPVTAGEPVRYTFQGSVPIGQSAKYDVGFYPSSYGTSRTGILNAITDGNFYYLDPFINNTRYEIGNVTNSSNPWTTDDNATASTANYTTETIQYTSTIEYSFIGTPNAYYSLDDDTISGGNYIDITGFGHDLNIYNADTGDTGIIKEAAGFVVADANNRLDGDASALQSSFTINAWINPNTLVNSHIVSKDDTSNRDMYISLRSDGNLWCRVNDKSDNIAITSGSPISTSSWSMVTCMVTNQGIEIWVDGSIVQNDSSTGSITWTGANWSIGGISGGGSDYFDGTIDEVGIWNNTLTHAQIQSLYNSGSGYDTTSLVYNTSNNLYQSVPIPMSFNASEFDITYSVTGTGSAGVTLTCDADDTANYSANLVSGSKGVSCPTVGDSLEYRITLSGGSTSVTPVVQNLSLIFYESVSVNTPPNVTTPTFTPTTPNATQDVTASTTYTDADGDNGTVSFNWTVGGSSVRYQVVNANDTDVVSDTLSSSLYSAGQTVAVVVIGNDGDNVSVSRQNSFVVAADTIIGSGASIADVLAQMGVYVLVLVLILGFWWLYINTWFMLYIVISIGLNLFLLIAAYQDLLFTAFGDLVTLLALIPFFLLALQVVSIFYEGDVS